MAQENTAKVIPLPAVQPLDGARMRECEFERTVWVITAHENTKPEDLLRLEYWTNVAEKLKPYDKIEARADDGTWYAEYLVVESERLWSRVCLLNKVDLDEAPKSDEARPEAEFRVEWKGPAHKWSVIRSSDSAMVKEGLGSRTEANAWVAARMKAGA
jgi:hypothetical protein